MRRDKSEGKLKAESKRGSKAHTKQVAKTKTKSSASATAARPAKRRRKGRESWLLITGSDASRSANLVPDEVQTNGFPSESERVMFTQALADIVSRDETIRIDAAKALADIRHPLSVRTLACQMTRETSPYVRQECVRALTKLEMKKGLPVIAHALTDPAAPVRLAAVWGLYYLAKQDSAVVLLSMFSDEDEEVRRRAATCIGWLGLQEHAVKMQPLLDDDSPTVRRAAAEAMGNLGSRKVVWSLTEHLNDPDRDVRKAILNALQEITGEKMSQAFPRDKQSLKRVTARWREWWKEEITVC